MDVQIQALDNLLLRRTVAGGNGHRLQRRQRQLPLRGRRGQRRRSAVGRRRSALADRDAAGDLRLRQCRPATGSAAAPTIDEAFDDVTTGTDTMTFRTQTITGDQATPGGTRSPAGRPTHRRLVALLARHASP